MRYRPFGRTGKAVSTLALILDGAEDRRAATDWRDLVHGAFEEGVNAFELVRPSEALLAGLAEGCAAVRRSLLFLGLRVEAGQPAQDLEPWVEQLIEAAGVGELDLLTVDPSRALAGPTAQALSRLSERRLAGCLGLALAADGPEAEIATGFGAIEAPFNLLSGWRERHLIRAAVERGMGVIACQPWPPELEPLIQAGRAAAKGGVFRRVRPLAGAGSYAFMAETHGWSSDQLCLAYALTEPAVATVEVAIADRKRLADLAWAASQDLPLAVAAQIEMARLAPGGERDAAGPERRSA